MRAPIMYRIVNVYAAQGFAGNPVAVITDSVDPTLMQQIARQLNCTATVFVRQTGPGAYSARMFSPKFEAAYGGAGSLGAVWAMGEGRWTQTTSGAVVETEYRDGHGYTTQPEPKVEMIPRDGLARAIGLRTIEGAYLGEAGGAHHLVVVTKDEPGGFAPDSSRLADIAARHRRCTIGAFRLGGDGTIHGRVFAPAQGVDEDPACAGGAGIVARVMQCNGTAGESFLIREGEEIGRPSRIEVVASAGAIRVGGPITLAADGRLHLG